jgi:hypothetical protein
MSQFILKIDLGNDAMKTPGDIIQALTGVIETLGENSNHPAYTKMNAGSIRDINGNVVGHYEVIP